MNALVQNNAIISCELTAVEMENINGAEWGWGCALGIAGYAVGVVGITAATGGLGTAAAIGGAGVAAANMLNECLWK